MLELVPLGEGALPGGRAVGDLGKAERDVLIDAYPCRVRRILATANRYGESACDKPSPPRPARRLVGPGALPRRRAVMGGGGAAPRVGAGGTGSRTRRAGGSRRRPRSPRPRRSSGGG